MNDPRITSYALGELIGSEREAFERELASSESLQRELNETIQLAEALGTLPMPTDTLPEETRSALREECVKNVKIVKLPSQRRKLVLAIGGLAGVLYIAFAMISAMFQPVIEPPDFQGGLAETSPVVSLPPPAPSVVQTPTLSAVTTTAVAPTQFEMNPTTATAVSSLSSSVAGQQFSGHVNYGSPVMVAQAATATEPEERFAGQVGDTANGLSKQLEIPVDALAPAAPAASAPVADASRFRAKVDVAAKPAPLQDFTTEAYDSISENVFQTALDVPLSTFSIDVDTASYANVRRFLNNEQVPPAGAIRTEELINYFPYNYPQPTNGGPFSVNLEASRAPWNGQHELVRIGLKGREVPASERGAANLVFLVDVSGSMDEPNKLPLLQRSLKGLVENVAAKDRVAIVVYAGSSGLVLPSTPGTRKARILEALENLKAGGSTNGAEGIRLAYNVARENFLKGGNNRVILCTDGDFNVGTTDQSELVRLIEKERTSGIFLSVLGFGTGNLKDSTMEKLADKGNGNYAYIDSPAEGRKVLVEQMGGTLFTIAKDVKIQVEFNPALVAGYRLIGYENRLLAKEDFNDDKKDAGEIGAGHTVTALYEIVPAGQPVPGHPSVDPLKYQTPAKEDIKPSSSKLLTVKLRYKAPDGNESQLLEVPLTAPQIPSFETASADFQFAAAVAAFGMKLRGSPDAGDLNWSDIQQIARRSLGEDPGSYRAEFLTLIEKASHLKPIGRTPEQ